MASEEAQQRVELQQRIVSAIVLIAMALAATLHGGAQAAAVIAALALFGIYEWVEMFRPQPLRLIQWLAVAAMGATFITAYFLGPGETALAGSLSALGVFLASAAGRSGWRRTFWTAFGSVYVGAGCLALLYTRNTPEHGLGLTVFLLLAVWGTDMGAYFFGRWLRGPRLCPAISPSKTWAGAFGGIAIAAILGYATARGFGVREPGIASGFAVALAIAAQLGDLFESYIKRRCGVKDSGQLIPGHGGMLDRIDGLIAASLFFMLLQVVGEGISWW
ncbi:MAG: phosphatidate cytidylyltransferase [Alphaproteobacteria bacterium]